MSNFKTNLNLIGRNEEMLLGRGHPRRNPSHLFGSISGKFGNLPQQPCPGSTGQHTAAVPSAPRQQGRPGNPEPSAARGCKVPPCLQAASHRSSTATSASPSRTSQHRGALQQKVLIHPSSGERVTGAILCPTALGELPQWSPSAGFAPAQRQVP